MCLQGYCPIDTNLSRYNDFQPTNMKIFTKMLDDCGDKDVFVMILSFRCVLYVVCFLLGNSPASEF